MHTTDLKHYPLPDRLRATLAQADQIAQTMARSGRPVPASIMLYADDFDAIDRIVRRVSGGHLRAARMQWSGRPLSRYVEPSLACAG